VHAVVIIRAMSNRLALLLVATVAVATRSQPHAQTRTFDLLTATVPDIQAAVASGALTYERLVQLYLSRIDAYDKKGPRLNAVLAINPRALEVARALDAERKAKGVRSPLHGIPIAVKDNVDVSDMPSAAGTLALAGSYPRRDATVISRLREAGAIIFLKTNMDELALGSYGLSSLGGQILNPYDLSRHPGGSSAGTAVAMTAGFATVGIATETGVSIRSPASNSSIVGIAPTEGLVSRAGVVPNSFTQDRIGPHARSVADAALLLSYMRGFDADDLSTSKSLGQIAPEPYAARVDDRALTGARIGVLRDLFRKGEEFAAINVLIEGQIDAIERAGAEVERELTTGTDLLAALPTMRLNVYELRAGLDAYLRRRDGPVKSLAELAASGKYLKAKRIDERFADALKVRMESDAEYLARLEKRRTVRQRLIDVMDNRRVDALVYPFKSLAAPLIGVGDDGIRDNPLSAVTGLPAIVVPAGVSAEGLPIAIEFLGRPFSEPRLIQLAHAYEQASRMRKAPPTTPPLPGARFAY
jgi:amidase